jgi:hypothetical protein
MPDLVAMDQARLEPACETPGCPVEADPWTHLSDNAESPKIDPQPLDAPPVHAEIGVPEARRRADSDQAFGRAEMQFEIIDETEQGAAALGMEIGIGPRDDRHTGDRFERLPNLPPRNVRFL